MLPIQKLFSANQRIVEINFEGIGHEYSLKEMYNCNSANELDILKKKYVDSQPAIMEEVGQVKDKNLLDQLTIFGFHEAYHLGQIGLIRKLFGKEGAIK